MLFHSTAFLLFLCAVLPVFYLLPKWARTYWLLFASYYFYWYWNPYFVPLLVGLTVADFVAAHMIASAPPARRKLLLFLGVSANLGMLGLFKYYNFAASNLAHLLARPENAFAINLVLPLGISFHTFQSISYLVDVYRGEQAPIRNFAQYALFISFFPQLVAGPIVRARDFFHDLHGWQAPDARAIQEGLFGIVLGLTKKLAFADRFAQAADSYFANLGTHPGSLAAWTGTLAFSLQIYFDFSGYTDMAIGIARLFGFHFPVNFTRPYLASSVTDFWRRWHISLSSWLRDYLYIPLGGNRKGKLVTYRNLMVTMALGGLWHGASWNFLIWGAIHGVLLSLERLGSGIGLPIPRVIRTALVFAVVSVAWVFFRASSLSDSVSILYNLFAINSGESVWEGSHYVLGAAAAIGAGAEERWHFLGRAATGSPWAFGFAVAGMLFCLECFAVYGQSLPFVYFQF